MQYKFLKITTSLNETEFEWEILDTKKDEDFLNMFLKKGFTLDEDGREELEEELLVDLYNDVCEYEEKTIFLRERDVMNLKLFLRK